MTSCMFLVALVLRLYATRAASNWLLASWIVMAALEVLFDFCLSCESFRVLMILDVLPTTVCERCLTMYAREKAMPPAMVKRLKEAKGRSPPAAGARQSVKAELLP